MTSTALLVMDVQRGIVERFPAEGYLTRLATAIAAARRAAVPVIYVVVTFRPGYPEISARNKSFGAVVGAGRFAQGDPSVAIPSAVAPAEGRLS
jgi:nicotinamidase-related amidase